MPESLHHPNLEQKLTCAPITLRTSPRTRIQRSFRCHEGDEVSLCHRSFCCGDLDALLEGAPLGASLALGAWAKLSLEKLGLET